MLKISNKVKKFIVKTMENWRMELKTGRKSLTEVKIQRVIFHGDALSPLLFVIVMVPLNHILRKCTGRYKLNHKKRSITKCTWMTSNCLPKTKRIGNPNTDSENIQSGLRDEI